MNLPIQRLAVAVITCNRLKSLERLLDHLARIQAANAPDLEIAVVVVENGRQTGAEELVRRFDSPRRPFIYDHEPRPGISFARNRAMELAVEWGDYFAFIDDDEWPSEQWLEALLGAADEFDAPVVCGNVRPVIPNDAPKWVKMGNFFEQRRWPTGARIRYVSTANVLIKSSLIRRTRLRFNHTFAITGGSDTLFFLQLCRLTGIEVVYSAEALVYEEIGPDRMQMRWLMRRALRSGANMWRTEAAMGAPGIYRLRWIGKGAVHAVLGSLRTLVGLVAGKVEQARGLRQAAKGVGMVWGACGRSVNEYHDRHDDGFLAAPETRAADAS